MEKLAESFIHLGLYKVLFDLRSGLRNYRDPRKMLIQGLRKARDVLGADAGAVAVLGTGHHVTELVYSVPARTEWDIGLINDYIKQRKPAIPPELVIAPIVRRDRTWGALVVRADHGQIEPKHVRALVAIAEVMSEAIAEYDTTRVRQIRLRLEHKIANREDPKDIIYDILHGLRTLTRYDHSASFLMNGHLSAPLQLVAEQIAWTKAKSKWIGMTVPYHETLVHELGVAGVRLFRRRHGAWQSPHEKYSPVLAEALAHDSRKSDHAPAENALLCAVVRTPDGAAGVFRLAFQRNDAVGRFEVKLVERFMPLLSLSLQFLHRTGVLTEQVLQAERKNALANLSRGIAHDVNNALGAVLPLVQQIRDDAGHGDIDPHVLCDDLTTIESGMRTCRRIFAGMLSVARSSDDSIGGGNLRRALDSCVNVIRNRLQRQSVEIKVEAPAELSTVKGNQGDLTQVFLNLFANALDAMPGGGRLTITARETGKHVTVVVADSGSGIPADQLEHVMDSFFTTKQTGNGLGLSICREIMWGMEGQIEMKSTEGNGTQVVLQFPIEPSQLDRLAP